MTLLPNIWSIFVQNVTTGRQVIGKVKKIGK